MSCISLWVVCCRHGIREGDVCEKYAVAVKKKKKKKKKLEKGGLSRWVWQSVVDSRSVESEVS